MRADGRLRLASGLLLSPQRDGRVVVWRSRRSEPYQLDVDLLALLLQFGDGRTRAEAAAAASLEDDDTVGEVVGTFVAEGLLVPAEALTESPPPVARERIAGIVDADSFVADAEGPVITGLGRAGTRRVAIAAWEPFSTAGIEDVLRLQERVAREPCPIVYLFD